jgi:hypothetical protein
MHLFVLALFILLASPVFNAVFGINQCANANDDGDDNSPQSLLASFAIGLYKWLKADFVFGRQVKKDRINPFFTCQKLNDVIFRLKNIYN